MKRLIHDPKTPHVAIALLFVIHMAIGLLGWDFVVEADGTEYLQIAQNLLDQGTFTYDGVNPVVGKPPGFPFLIAAYMWLTGSLLGFHWLQLILMYVAFVFVAATTARWIGWTRAQLVLVLLVSTWPLHVLTHHLFAEAPFLALTSAGLYLLVRAASLKWLKYGVLAGLAFGISVYFRPINLFWPILLLLSISIWQRRNMRLAITVCVVHFLVVSPWICRNWLQFGRLVPMVANWGPLYYMTEPDLWEIYFFQGSGVIRASEPYRDMAGGEFQFNWRPSERFRRAALDNIRRDPLGYAGRCVRQSLFAWTYVPGTKEARAEAPAWFLLGRAGMLVFYLITTIGAVGLLRLQRPFAGLPAAYAGYTALILFPVCTESRYLIPAYMWLSPYTMAGIGVGWRFVRTRGWKKERK